MSEEQKRVQALADFLFYEHELTLTKEGLKPGSDSLRIADYGGDNDFGETVYIGNLPACEHWAAARKGYRIPWL